VISAKFRNKGTIEGVIPKNVFYTDSDCTGDYKSTKSMTSMAIRDRDHSFIA